MGNESNAKVKNGALNTAGLFDFTVPGMSMTAGKLLGKIAKFLYAG